MEPSACPSSKPRRTFRFSRKATMASRDSPPCMVLIGHRSRSCRKAWITTTCTGVRTLSLRRIDPVTRLSQGRVTLTKKEKTWSSTTLRLKHLSTSHSPFCLQMTRHQLENSKRFLMWSLWPTAYPKHSKVLLTSSSMLRCPLHSNSTSLPQPAETRIPPEK